MADINTILKNNGSIKQSKEKSHYEVTMIHYSQIKPSKMQFYRQEDIEEQADAIELAGGIMQPLVVRRQDADQYELLAGHRRLEAVKRLVEDRQLTQYAMVPCHIEKANDWRAEYLLITTNSYREKTGYEKMLEVQRLAEIIPHLPGSEELKGRALRGRIAKELKTGETSVQNYNYIYTHLCAEGMEAYRAGDIKTAVANELAHLDEEDQKILLKTGDLTAAAIAEYKKAKSCQNLTQNAASEEADHIRKPTQEEREVLNVFAKQFIRKEKDWLLENFEKRVMDVTTSPYEILKRYGESNYYFQLRDMETGHIEFQNECIRLYDVKHLIGKFEWFYLAAAIQSMWNAVAIENAENERKKNSVSNSDTKAYVPYEESMATYGKDFSSEKDRNKNPENEEELARKMIARYAKYDPKGIQQVLEICRRNSTNNERAQAVRDFLSPNGYSGGARGDFDFLFKRKELTFESGKENVTMSYIKFVNYLNLMFGPFEQTPENNTSSVVKIEIKSREKKDTEKITASEQKEILKSIIDDNKKALETMEDYCSEHRPQELWKHRLTILAAEHYIELLESGSESSTEDGE